ncbi:hypothetical protein B2K_40380 [Paenibacillus mucilaginosus K02]|uniref:Uncharacterized protein n=1 Tax=Paenibacillus mucilaginosus K02 TaxID=997761 RepID=R9UQ78_9BACL|nr:hypothetical protein B2K_40380 [Paenibacillus mucilaginosus K02]
MKEATEATEEAEATRASEVAEVTGRLGGPRRLIRPSDRGC